MSDARYVLVIMPIGSEPLARAKKSEIADGLAKAGHSAKFPDYGLAEDAHWLPSLLEEIRNADFVFADLSLERPSCYYELGVAEALGKPVYLIAESGTPIHQCASRSTVSFYCGLHELTGVVKSAVNEGSRKRRRDISNPMAIEA